MKSGTVEEQIFQHRCGASCQLLLIPPFAPPVGLNDGPPELRSYQARGCQVGLGAAKEERNTLQPHTDLLTEVNLCPAPSTGAAGLRAE